MRLLLLNSFFNIGLFSNKFFVDILILLTFCNYWDSFDFLKLLLMCSYCKLPEFIFLKDNDLNLFGLDSLLCNLVELVELFKLVFNFENEF